MNTGDNYTVRGNATGSAFGPGAHVHNRDVWGWPAAELLELADRVSSLADRLSPSERAELIQAHHELEQAANSARKNPSRLHAAGERLKRVVTTIGTVAPVLEAVNNLLKAFGVA